MNEPLLWNPNSTAFLEKCQTNASIKLYFRLRRFPSKIAYHPSFKHTNIKITEYEASCVIS